VIRQRLRAWLACWHCLRHNVSVPPRSTPKTLPGVLSMNCARSDGLLLADVNQVLSAALAREPAVVLALAKGGGLSSKRGWCREVDFMTYRTHDLVSNLEAQATPDGGDGTLTETARTDPRSSLCE